MTRTSHLLSLLMLALACLTGTAWSEDKPAKTSTVQGLIDSIDVEHTKLVIKSNADNPAKAHTTLIIVDAATKITIDKQPATFADLKEQDAVKATYCQGTATTVTVTRTPAAAKPKK